MHVAVLQKAFSSLPLPANSPSPKARIAVPKQGFDSKG